MWGFCTVLNDIVSRTCSPSLISVTNRPAWSNSPSFCLLYFFHPRGEAYDATSYKTSIVFGLLTMAAGAFCSFRRPPPPLSIYSRGIGGAGGGDHGSPGCANPYVRCSPAKNRVQPLESHPGVQLPRHHDRPLIGGMLILSTTAKARPNSICFRRKRCRPTKWSKSLPLRPPYIFIGLLLVALAMVIYSALAGDSPGPEESHTPGVSLWKYRHLVLVLSGFLSMSVRKSPSGLS